MAILEAQFEDDLRRCQSEPFVAFVDAFSTARQLSLLGVDAPEQRAAGCLRFELTMTTTTTWEHTPTDTTFSSSARAIVPVDLLGGSAASVPLEGVGQTGDPVTQGCTWLAKGLHPTVFEIAGLSLVGGGSFIDSARAGTFGPEDLRIEFRPGELGERWATVCGADESEEGTYPEVYKLAFELLHGPTPTVSGFTRVPGAVWAAEVRFERRQTAPSTEVRGEQTRFFLRSTPQTGP